jgi:5-methylcytosine-specific restriction endonuclease McrA
MIFYFTGSWAVDIGSGDTRHYCKECTKSFAHSSALSRHRSNAHGPSSHPVTCDICHMVYKNLRSLKEHMFIKHNTKMLFRQKNNVEQLQCKYCGKLYTELRHFKSHLLTMHPNEDIEDSTTS